MVYSGSDKYFVASSENDTTMKDQLKLTQLEHFKLEIFNELSVSLVLIGSYQEVQYLAFYTTKLNMTVTILQCKPMVLIYLACQFTHYNVVVS